MVRTLNTLGVVESKSQSRCVPRTRVANSRAQKIVDITNRTIVALRIVPAGQCHRRGGGRAQERAGWASNPHIWSQFGSGVSRALHDSGRERGMEEFWAWGEEEQGDALDAEKLAAREADQQHRQQQQNDDREAGVGPCVLYLGAIAAWRFIVLPPPLLPAPGFARRRAPRQVVAAGSASAVAQRFVYGAPRLRTPAQHMALTAKMRECRLRNRCAARSQAQVVAMTDFAQKVSSSGGVRANTELEVKSDGIFFDLSIVTRRRKQPDENPRRRVMSCSAMQQMAFQKNYNRSVLSNLFSVSAKTVRRVLCSVAHASSVWEHTGLQMLTRLVTEFPPDFAVVSLAWDETGQKLMFAPSSSTNQSAAWEVLVSRVRFAWGWGDRSYNLEAVLAPVPLRSNASAHLKSGLSEHPLNRPAMQFAEALLDRAKAAVRLHCADGHFANIKLHASVAEADDRSERGVMNGFLHCGNHCNNLVSVAVTTSLSLDVVNDLYAATLFLKMGCHFLMLQSAIRRVVSESCRRVVGVPSAEAARAHAYTSELEDYFCATFTFHPGRSATTAPTQ